MGYWVLFSGSGDLQKPWPFWTNVIPLLTTNVHKIESIGLLKNTFHYRDAAFIEMLVREGPVVTGKWNRKRFVSDRNSTHEGMIVIQFSWTIHMVNFSSISHEDRQASLFPTTPTKKTTLHPPNHPTNQTKTWHLCWDKYLHLAKI